MRMNYIDRYIDKDNTLLSLSNLQDQVISYQKNNIYTIERSILFQPTYQ